MSESLLLPVIERMNRWRFGRAVRRVRETAPARIVSGAPLTVLSMVNHRDVDAYLVAVKSLCRHAEVGRVVLVADPTLTDADRALLSEHVPGIRFRTFAQSAEPGLPRGGCWERIIAIADECAESFVVQLDADTVTIAPVDEVGDHVAHDRAFMLASWYDIRIAHVSHEASVARARLTPASHIQLLAEANLDALQGEHWRYARGCAAFAGFPQGSFSRKTLLEISRAMEGRIGARWSEWGSEQVVSNLICASQPGTQLLPHPKYCNADQRTDTSAFLHYIGYTRFTSGQYRADAVKIIAEQVGQRELA